MSDTLELRIYYEDTDAQGVVFYANYLKYFERARTEFLRKCGYLQNELLAKNIIFIVNKLDIHYKKQTYPVRSVNKSRIFSFRTKES